MRILVFGKTGQVARELSRVRWALGCHVQQLAHSEADLLDTAAVRNAILGVRPEIVINAAGYTAVDRAEVDHQAAEMVNRDAPAAMAVACRHLGAKLIHLSTDYVFDGFKAGPYLERDPIGPLSVYGCTKADGEIAIREALPQHVILRTSWVFASHGANFLLTMLRLANERPAQLRVVADQKGAPTAAYDIALAIASIVRQIKDGNGAWGTFHFTGSEPTTWYNFARAIFGLSQRDPVLIPITSAEYAAAARRPSNSVLDCEKIARDYGIGQPSWRTALEHVLRELGEFAEPAQSAVLSTCR
jgi:dTDP-4-dehydrorhamnose reductase